MVGMCATLKKKLQRFLWSGFFADIIGTGGASVVITRGELPEKHQLSLMRNQPHTLINRSVRHLPFKRKNAMVQATISSNKTVERYLSPKLGMIATIIFPLFSARDPTFSAQLAMAPDEIPTKIPSSRASCRET